MEIDGEQWMNTEQYYQAMKFIGDGASKRMIEYSNIIKSANTNEEVKLLGNKKKSGLKLKIKGELVNDIVESYSDVEIRKDWKE